MEIEYSNDIKSRLIKKELENRLEKIGNYSTEKKDSSSRMLSREILMKKMYSIDVFLYKDIGVEEIEGLKGRKIKNIKQNIVAGINVKDLIIHVFDRSITDQLIAIGNIFNFKKLVKHFVD